MRSYCVSLGISISCGYACAFLQPTNNNVLHSAQPAAMRNPFRFPCSTTFDADYRHRLRRFGVIGSDDENESASADNNNNSEEPPIPERERAPPKPKNIWQTIFDPIVTSPILPIFLFWGPFLQNPYNKRKFAELTANTNPLVVDAFLGALAATVIAYVAYNARVEAAEEASEVRELALRDLRTARQGQFTSNRSQQTTSDAVQEAAETYEEALRKELKLRWISPQLGWRLDFPDDPASREEDQAAARQFLGLEITHDGNIIELR